MPLAELIQCPDDAVCGQADVDLDPQDIAGVVVNDIEGPIAAAVRQAVPHEIDRPALAWLQRLKQGLRRSDDASSPTTAQGQAVLPVEPFRPFVVDRMPFMPQLPVQLRTAPGRM